MPSVLGASPLLGPFINALKHCLPAPALSIKAPDSSPHGLAVLLPQRRLRPQDGPCPVSTSCPCPSFHLCPEGAPWADGGALLWAVVLDSRCSHVSKPVLF